MNILVTGCAGFIGSNLVKALYKNHDLILVDDLSEGKVKNLPKTIQRKLDTKVEQKNSYEKLFKNYQKYKGYRSCHST